jgi:4-hydroxy-tetrahydrodipicolinate synthase
MKKGAYTLMITPFREDLSLDEEGLSLLVKRQLAAGIHGIAPLGVTGENTLMSDFEVYRVVEIIVDEAKGKALIIPDTCSENYNIAKARVKKYAELGADYVSVFAPYFVLPKADGIIKFYSDLADYSEIPIILHGAKTRTGIELTPEISATLAKHPNIIGIKDGNKDLGHLSKVIHLTREDDFEVYTGKDTTAFATALMGGAGTFTVAGNIIPEVMANMVNLIYEGKAEEAKEIHHHYFEVFDALRFETNPMAVKAALNLMGLPAGGLRPPLTPLSEKYVKEIESILKERKVI